jgi:hypothetical protein
MGFIQAAPLRQLVLTATLAHTPCTMQVAELAAYVALLADWSVLADASTGAWRPLVTLAAVVALPVAYSRRIVDFGGAGTADC